MTHTVHSSSSLWLVKLATSFDFCDKDEKKRVYHALCAAWNWGARVK